LFSKLLFFILIL